MSDNTGSNLGTGQGVFSGKVGDDLQFKSLVGGTSITLSADANEITINSSALVSTATNLGSGTGLFVDVTTGSINFRGIALGTGADSGLKISSNATTVLLSIDSANLNAGTLGGLASSAFLQKSDNLAAVTDVATARTNLGVYSKTETDAKYFLKDGDGLPDTDNTRSLGSGSKRFSDVHAVEFHGTATYAGTVTSIGTHDIGGLNNVDETGKAAGHVLKYNGTTWVSTADGGATNIGALTDVDISGIANGQVLKFDSSTSKFIAADDSGAGGGSSTFVGLSDTPSNYSGAASKFVKANAAGNGIEFVADPGYVTDLSSFTTANLTENTNLYYTDARVDTRIGATSINALSDVDTSGASVNDILKWNGTNWTPQTDAGGIALSDLSTTTGAASSGGSLSYNNGTGVFTFNPADVSSFITASSTETLTNKSGAISMFTNDSNYLTAITGQSLYSLNNVWTSSNPSDGQVLTWDNANSYWKPSNAGSGTVTSITAGTGLTGGTITASGTIAVDVGTSAGKIVQLDGTGKLPAIDGSQLTGVSTTTSFAGLTDTPANFTGSANKLVRVNAAENALEFITNNIPADTDGLSEGSTNLYYTDARSYTAFDTRLATKSTTNLSEGTNLYYTDARVDTHLNQSNPTSGYVLSWNGSDYVWVENGTGGITDIVNDTTPQLGGTLDANGNTIDMGTNVLTDTNLGQFITAYGWGDHGAVGYLTSVPAQSFASLTGKPTTLAGYGITDGYANTDVDAHLNQSNPTAGYVLSWSGTDYAWVTNAGYTNTDFDNRLATKTTDNLSEGSTNLYFTNARADARIGAASLTALSDVNTGATSGQVLKWNGSAWAPANDTDTVYSSFNSDFDTRLAAKDTGDLSEGSNLYYTDARSRAAISASGALSYNSGTGALTFTQGDTDTVSEGSTNLYFTNARARSSISLGSAGSQAYNSGTGVLTVPGTTDHITEGSNLFYTNARADARVQAVIIDEDNMASDDNTKVPTQQSVKAYVDSQVASENELSEMNDVTIASIQNNQFLKYNTGTSKWENASVTAATAAGSDTFVQFNDGGVMGGDSDFVYNKTTNALTVGSISTVGSSGSVSSTADLDITTSANNSNIGLQPHGTGNIELGTNTIIDGSDNDYLKWTAPYSNEAALPSASTYHGMFAHVHATGKGYFAHAGNWIKLIDETSSTTTNLSEGTNLYYTDARARAAISEGSAQLSYNSGTGVLTFTQDDTDGISEGSTNLYFTNARADARITNATLDEDNMASNSNTKIATQQSIKAYVDSSTANGDTAYGWGDHGAAGYLTSETFTSVVQDTTPQLGGTLDANGNTIDMGTNTITDTKVGYWDTAYGWGDHGSAGYQSAAGLNAAIDTHLNQSNPTSGYVLSWNGSDYAWVTNAGYTDSDFDTRLASKTTANLTEGSNLYYTNARADARIAAAGLTTLGDVDAVVAGDDGKILYYDHSSTSFKWKADATGGGTLNTAGNTGTGSVTLASETLTVTGTTGQIVVDAAAFALSLSLDPNINSITSIAFEGSTADTNETKLQAVDPTADRTINLPDASGHLPVFATASPAAITDGTNGQALVTNGSGQLSFTTISGGGTDIQRFKINYATNGQLSSITDKTSGISSVSIDSAAGGDITINFTGYNYPPGSVTLYGYNYSANKYNVTPLNKDITLREIPGGGSSGSPTAFGSFSSMKIKASEGDAGASRSFGTVTHTWVHLVMGG